MANLLPNLPPALRRAAAALAAMMAAALAFTAAMTHWLHTPRLYGLAWIPGYWADFRIFQDQSLHFRTPAYWNDYGYPFTYPAPDAVLFGVAYKLPHPLWTYLAILLAGLAAWLLWLTRGLQQRGVPQAQSLGFGLIVLGTAWPLYYLFNTGNLEGLMAILLGLGVLAVLRERCWTGAALLGIATAMKYYPIALLVLLLSRRRYKEFFAALALIATLTLGSLALIGPSIPAAQAHLNDGLEFFRQHYIVLRGSIWLNYSHSLFNSLKYAVLLIDRLLNHHGASSSPEHEQALLDSSLRVYTVVAAIFAVVLYFWRIRTLPMLNQVLALTACAVVLPPFSSDYSLINLLVPFALLSFYAVENFRAGRTIPGLQTCLVCLCLGLGFESFFTWKYAFASSIRALALLTLLAVALRVPLPWSEIDG
jgi:hypothetical protein